jgi:hypothetical protein
MDRTQALGAPTNSLRSNKARERVRASAPRPASRRRTFGKPDDQYLISSPKTYAVLISRSWVAWPENLMISLLNATLVILKSELELRL